MSTRTAEIISIGDEMTSGARLDTNSQWLCQRLGDLGLMVRFKSTVGDCLRDNIDVLQTAASRADLVITTGGLGPTADDLTRDALAALVGKPLVQNDAALAHIEAMFLRRGRQMPPRNCVQALFPVGSLEIPNSHGTAPGVDLQIARGDGSSARIFALPGVPAEMKEMFTETVGPRIIQHIGGGRRVLKQTVIKCFGLGESELEARLGRMIARTRSPRVGITVSAATISLRITAEAESEPQCDQMIAATRQEILAAAGEYVFGEGEDFELQHALATSLAESRQRIASLEIGHAAPLAGWLADVVPREVYAGGVIASAVDHAEHALRRRFVETDADWLLVVDRYPSLQTADDVVADLTLTLCGRERRQYWQQHCRLGGHPGILHARIGKTAIAFANSILTHADSVGKADLFTDLRDHF